MTSVGFELDQTLFSLFQMTEKKAAWPCKTNILHAFLYDYAVMIGLPTVHNGYQAILLLILLHTGCRHARVPKGLSHIQF